MLFEFCLQEKVAISPNSAVNPRLGGDLYLDWGEQGETSALLPPFE